MGNVSRMEPRGRKQLRVCFVSSYPPNHAHLSEYAQDLVAALANKPEIETMYLLVDKSKSPEKMPPDNPKVKIFRVWKSDGLFSVLSVLFYILKLRPDVVHFNVSFQSFGKNKLTNITGLSLILLCRLLRFRVLAGVHTLAEVTDLEKFQVKSSLLNRIGILMATKIILSAQSVVVLVRSYGDVLKKRYDHKGVYYIPHGASVDTEAKENTAGKTILIFGHMGPHKGLPIMLMAFERISRENPSIKLIVAGSNHPNFPNYLKEFTKMHIPNVEFLGYIPQDKLGSVFRKATLVVLPYNAAPGTSGVFHLACGYGLPIVASDLPEIRELVKDGASAILVPPGDVDALKDAVLTVLSNVEVASKMSMQNLSFAKKESWSAVAEAYQDAYEAS
jgi:glycosyltransferase involved in cell wall biosynthesis